MSAHARRPCSGAACLCSSAAVGADPPVHDYPTQARVEYVQGMHRNTRRQAGESVSVLVRHRSHREHLSYDDFVEASTFAKYSGLPGEGGGIFRDSDQARTDGEALSGTRGGGLPQLRAGILKSRRQLEPSRALAAARARPPRPTASVRRGICRTARSVAVSTMLTSFDGPFAV